MSDIDNPTKGQIEGSERLKGLRSYADLSPEERHAWLEANPSLKKETGRQVAAIYDNRKFLDYFNNLTEDKTLGNTLFTKYNKNQRDAIFKDTYIGNVTEELYKDKVSDDDWDAISKLPTEYKERVIRNNFQTIEQIEVADEDDYKTAKELMASGGDSNAYHFANQMVADRHARNTEALHSVVSDYQRELLNESKTYADSVIDKVNKGELDAEEELAKFDDKVNSKTVQVTDEKYGTQEYEYQGSNYWQTFKDSKYLQDFTDIDKIRLNAQYEYIASKYGDLGLALGAVDTALQDTVADNQNLGDRAGVAVNGIWTKAVAEIMQAVDGVALFGMGLYDIVSDDHILINAFNGKDTEGNDLPTWLNLGHWNDVYQYGTFDSNELNLIKKRGGLSTNQVITRAGEEYSNIHKVLNEATQQMGNALGQVAMMYVAGGIGGALTKGAAKSAQMIGKGLQGVGIALSAVPEATMESKIVFDDIKARESAKSEDAARKISENYAKSELASGKYNSLINERVQQRVKQFKEEQRQANPTKESSARLQVDDKELERIARQEITENLESYLALEHFNNNKDSYIDQEALNRDALTGALITYGLFMARGAAENFAFKSFIFDKGTRAIRSKFLNQLNRSLETASDGTKKVINKTLNKAIAIAEPAVGGGLSEYNDTLTEEFAINFGLNKYNNYVIQKYDKDDFIRGAHLMSDYSSNFVAGMKGLKDAMTSKDAWYEAAIGAIAPGTTFSIASLSDIASISQDKNAGWLRKANHFIKNPLVSAYFDEVERQEGLEKDLKVYNEVVTKHSGEVERVGEIVKTLNQRDPTVTSVLQAKDAKEKEAYSIIKWLATLESSVIGEQNEAAKEAMAKLKAYSKATNRVLSSNNRSLVNQAIDEFLIDPANKEFVKSMSKEEAREFAAKRLQSNATQLLTMIDSFKAISQRLGASETFLNASEDAREQIIYETVMNESWKSRLQSLLKETTGSSEISYNESPAKLIASKTELEFKIAEAEKRLKVNKEKLESLKETNKGLQESLLSGLANEERKKTEESISDNTAEINRLNSLVLYYENELSDYRSVEDSWKEGNTPVLSREEILALNPKERADLFKNKSKYSKKQQAIISDVEVQMDSLDPDYIQKTQDAGELYQRIADNRISISLISQNLKEFDKYVGNLKARRFSRELIAAQDDLIRTFNYETEDLNDEQLIDYVVSHPETSSDLIEAYIKTHPSKGEALRPILKVKKLQDDLNASINNADPNAQVYKTMLAKATMSARTEEEAMSNLEDLIDAQTDPQAKLQLDLILQKAQDLGHLRDVTKVRNREVERKAEEKKEAARQARKKKAEERKKKAETAKSSDTTPQSLSPQDLEEEAAQIPDAGAEPIQVADVDLGDNEVTIDAESKTQSPTIDSQVKQEDAVEVTPMAVSQEDEEVVSPNDGPTLPGNRYQQYSVESLKGGEVKEEEVKDPDSPFSQFMQFCKEKGIKLQEIIDNELGLLWQKNHKIPIHFMILGPIKGQNKNAADNRNALLINVIEYTDEVAKIHKEERGGVITDRFGKQWLVVGSTGFERDGATKEQRDAFRTMSNPIRRRANTFFKDKAGEGAEFYVDTQASTIIQSTTSGNIVRKDINEEESGLKKLSTVLSKVGKKLSSAKFFIQNRQNGITKSAVTKNVTDEEKSRIFNPRDTEANVGRVFVLMPTPNGNLVPGYIETTMYSELKDGTPLKDEFILPELLRLSSLDYNTRVDAIKRLCTLLVLQNDGPQILIGSKDSNVITLRRTLADGSHIDQTFTLGESFDISKFLKSVEDLGLRVNITAASLSDSTMLQVYDDSGALMTNLTRPTTVGMTYSVYPTDEDGNPIITKPEGNNGTPGSRPETRARISVPVNGTVYTLTKENRWVDKNTGKVVEAGSPLEVSCTYMRDIQYNNRKPFMSTAKSDYYLYKNNEGVEFLAVKGPKNNITLLSPTESRPIIEKTRADLATQEQLERANKKSLEDAQDVDLGTSKSEVTQKKSAVKSGTKSKSKTTSTIDKTKFSKVENTEGVYYYEDKDTGTTQISVENNNNGPIVINRTGLSQLELANIGDIITNASDIETIKTLIDDYISKLNSNTETNNPVTPIEKNSLSDLEKSEFLPIFASIMDSIEYSDSLIDILLNKGWGITDTMSYEDILGVLKSHNVTLAGVDLNSEESVKDWMNLIKDCR